MYLSTFLALGVSSFLPCLLAFLSVCLPASLTLMPGGGETHRNMEILDRNATDHSRTRHSKRQFSQLLSALAGDWPSGAAVRQTTRSVSLSSIFYLVPRANRAPLLLNPTIFRKTRGNRSPFWEQRRRYMPRSSRWVWTHNGLASAVMKLSDAGSGGTT